MIGRIDGVAMDKAPVPIPENSKPAADISAAQSRERVTGVHCRLCGHEPAEPYPASDERCPKCLSTGWVSFVRLSSRRTAGSRRSRRVSAVRRRSP